METITISATIGVVLLAIIAAATIGGAQRKEVELARFTNGYCEVVQTLPGHDTAVYTWTKCKKGD